MTVTSEWLPEGELDSWGLEVLRKQPSGGAGDFAGGGLKTVWHTTEGGNMAGLVRDLRARGAEPHGILDPLNGRFTQLLPFDQAARALKHPSGPETNRANCVQIELIGFAAVDTARRAGASLQRAVPNWGADEYRRIAALALLIEHRHATPRHARSFSHPKRMGGQEFVDFAGHCGHVHVPGNDHVDPGPAFDWPRLVALMNRLDH